MTEIDVAVKHFDRALKALYDLTGLFVNGPLRKELKRSEVRAALSALAQVAKDMPGVPGGKMVRHDCGPGGGGGG